jgi:hypothetical protein
MSMSKSKMGLAPLLNSMPVRQAPGPEVMD